MAGWHGPRESAHGPMRTAVALTGARHGRCFPRTDVRGAARRRSSSQPRHRPPTPRDRPRRPSSLAAENDLFATAVRAKRQGRLDDAARLFAELATSHPGGPLVESAVVQRMNILATTDPAAAARAAAAYLERFPGGFARAEAQASARPFVAVARASRFREHGFPQSSRARRIMRMRSTSAQSTIMPFVGPG